MNDLLIGHPVITTEYTARTLGISVSGAQRAIDKLVEAQVLTESTKGLRDRVWQSNAVLDVLDGFAEEIKRVRARRS